MYTKSRNLLDCHIAGFAYYDGLDVIDQLRLGTKVSLQSEPENPYDPEAVAIYYKGLKLGYVPRYKNAMLSQLLYFGHGKILQARICSRDLSQHPERQFRIVIRLKDKRDAKK